MRKKEQIFRLVAVLLGLGGSALVGEIAIRLLAPDWLRYRMEFLASGQTAVEGGSDLEWPIETVEGQFLRFKPNQQFRVANPEYQHAAHIDEFGGRATCARLRSETARAVLLFGDSFTFGIGVEDCDTFASLLASNLEAFRVVNLGVPGTALPEHLFIASKRQSTIGEGAVLLFFVFLGNDIDGMIEAKPYWWEAPEGTGSEKVGQLKRSTVSRKLLEVLNAVSHRRPFSHSYLVQMSRTVALRMLLGQRATSVDPIFKGMFTRNAEYLDAMRTALRQNLTQLRTLAPGVGTTALLVAIPDRYQIVEAIRNRQAEYYGLDVKDLDRFLPNRLLAEESAAAGIPLLDPSQCLDAGPEKSNYYYTGDNHFTKVGHRAFFDCIQDSVRSVLGNAR